MTHCMGASTDVLISHYGRARVYVEFLAYKRNKQNILCNILFVKTASNLYFRVKDNFSEDHSLKNRVLSFHRSLA